MELIEIKETGKFFRITEKEQIFFIPQEEKEKTTLEYALPRYTGYELYYEGGGSRPVQFVSKTGKVRTLKSEATIQEIERLEYLLKYKKEKLQELKGE